MQHLQHIDHTSGATHSTPTKVMARFMSLSPSLESVVKTGRDLPGFCVFDTANGQSVVTWSHHPPHTKIDGWKAYIRDNIRATPADQATYSGGVVGWLGYEAGRSMETMPLPAMNRPAHDICLWRTDGAIVQDQHTGTMTVHGAESFRTEAAALLKAASLVENTASIDIEEGHWEPNHHPLQSAKYTEGVKTILGHVRAGDVYQVNLAWEQAAIPTRCAASVWLRLRAENPAARGCYLRQGDVEIISNSPELFLSVDPQKRRVTSIPIKGTAAVIDGVAAKTRLEVSPKERAELTMIVDLVRNDLGRVAEPGSVTASHRNIRQCGNLWHAEQEVSAVLAPGHDAVSTVAAAFPPGSVTGAPKVRAMAVIHALEPTPRGVYTGTIGWFADGGGAHLNVAIRTATVIDGMARFHVGAGIVAESQPNLEWLETLAKADALSRCLNS
jgi:para-aminobenzoate synthetase component I